MSSIAFDETPLKHFILVAILLVNFGQTKRVRINWIEGQEMKRWCWMTVRIHKGEEECGSKMQCRISRMWHGRVWVRVLSTSWKCNCSGRNKFLASRLIIVLFTTGITEKKEKKVLQYDCERGECTSVGENDPIANYWRGAPLHWDVNVTCSHFTIITSLWLVSMVTDQVCQKNSRTQQIYSGALR